MYGHIASLASLAASRKQRSAMIAIVQCPFMCSGAQRVMCSGLDLSRDTPHRCVEDDFHDGPHYCGFCRDLSPSSEENHR